MPEPRSIPTLFGTYAGRGMAQPLTLTSMALTVKDPDERMATVYQGLLVGSAVVVAIAQIASAFTPSTAIAAKGVLGTITAVLGVAVVVFAWRKSKADESARAKARELLKAEKERSAILLGYNLREVFDAIDGLARRAPASRHLEIAGVRQSAAVQTKEGVAALAVRAAYYRIDDLNIEDRTMAPDKVAGSPDRTDKFTTTFVESSGRHPNVWTVLDGREPTYFVEDVKTHADPRIDFSYMDRFATFITARVSAGGINFGVLTVNATKAGSLVREDLFLVEAIARALAIAELLCLSTTNYTRALTTQARRDGMSQASPTLTIEGETDD